MSFSEFAFRMFPYWGLGALMGWAIWKSDYKDLLKFDIKVFAKFFLFMLAISAFRYFLIRTIVHFAGTDSFQAVNKLPIGAVFFVFWEDLCHSVPLVLLRRMIGTSKWVWPIHALAMIGVTLSFGSGHLYQGFLSAAFISLYIPWSVGFVQKNGAGTIAVNHTLYDLLTILTIRLAIG